MSNIIRKENKDLAQLEIELNDEYKALRISTPLVYNKTITLHNGIYTGVITVV